jgi:hypothetical protein
MSVRDTSHPIGAATRQQIVAEVVAIIAVVRIGEQGDEILQGQVIGLVGDAVDREPRQRQHDQQDQAHREQRQHRFGPVDLAFGGVEASGDGHLFPNLKPLRHSGACIARTRNLEIPGLRYAHPGMTMVY